MKLRSGVWHTWLTCVALLAGCSVAERREVTDEFFFPPAPNPARVQYVKTLSSSTDIVESSGLMDFVAGPGDVSEYGLAKPFSVAAWKGRVYVTDSYGARGLNVFDLNNETFYILGKKPGPGHLVKPMHVFVDEEGFKYVSDLSRKRVIVYGPADSYVRSYGDGASFTPIACVVHGDEIYILDVQKDAVQVERGGTVVERDKRRDQILVVDKETGKPLRRIAEQGAPEIGFAYAGFLGVDGLGHIYVSDFLHHRVIKLDSQGNVFLEFGGHGDRPGAFPKPKGMAVDRRGLIYVADAELHAVQVFDASGQLLFFFGEATAPEGRTSLPAGMWIDYSSVERFRDYYGPDFEPEYLIFVANQIGDPPGIAVYAYGRRRSHEYPPEDNVATLEKIRAVPLWGLPVFPPDVYRSLPATPAEKGRRESK